MTAADILAFNELKRTVEAHRQRKLAPPAPEPTDQEKEAAYLRSEIQRLRREGLEAASRRRHGVRTWQDEQREREMELGCRSPRGVTINADPRHECSWQHAQAVLDARERVYWPFARAWRDGGLR